MRRHVIEICRSSGSCLYEDHQGSNTESAVASWNLLGADNHGLGFAAAALYAAQVQKHPMVAPSAEYYLLTAGGITVSLGIIAATFPLLARITGPEVARNE